MAILDIPCITNSKYCLNVRSFCPSATSQPSLLLYVPPFATTPPLSYYPAPSEKPNRICLDGSLQDFHNLCLEVSWHPFNHTSEFPICAGGHKFPDPAFRQTYHCKVRRDIVENMVAGDEDKYKGWITKAVYVMIYLTSIFFSNSPQV